MFENQHVEFKQSFSSYSLKNSLKDIIAFANTDGGSIYYGIRDDGIKCGIKINSLDDTQKKIFNFISNNVIPKNSILFRIKFYSHGENKFIIKLKIIGSVLLVTDKKNNKYYRCGSSSMKYNY